MARLDGALKAEIPSINRTLETLKLEPLSIAKFERPFLKIN